MTALDAILQRLAVLHPKAIDLSLDRIRRLLADLGDPHLALPPVFHVAGSKGKGSTTAFLRAMAEAAGYRVHAYTSPHLVRFNERIRLNGQLIDDAYLLALLERCERVNAGRPITFFEITTAAAFLAFAETPSDLVLLETGLGGIADTTNVVPRPLLTALTPIGIDHVGFLGDTVGKIAVSKAGIIKPGVPCIVGPQPDEAMAVIAAKAAACGAPLLCQGRDWWAEMAADGGLLWRDGTGPNQETLHLPAPALPGAHQIVNAGIAVACARHLAGIPIPQTALAAGLRDVDWPARMQRLRRGPIADALPGETEIWLDGAHNAMAGVALADTLAALPPPPSPGPCLLIAGVLNTKDAAGLLRPLAPLVTGGCAVAIPGESNSLSAEQLAQAAAQAGLHLQPQPSIAAAVAAIAARRPARLLITGSLYLAGHILSENQ